LGLFSLVTLFADQQKGRMMSNAVRQAAWYDKPHSTFSDALALARKGLWTQEATFCGSAWETEMVKVPRVLVERLIDEVCYVA
jgi:hypothetical protein